MMQQKKKRAVEMAGYGKRGKPKQRVSHRFPQPLEIAARFPHSHGYDGDRVEKWKSKNRIPTFPLRLLIA